MECYHLVFVDPDFTWRDTVLRAVNEKCFVSILCSEQFDLAYPTIVSLGNYKARLDTSSIYELAEQFTKLSRERKINGVFLSRDAIIHQVSIACEMNNIKFTPSGAIAICRSKLKTRQLMRKSALATPNFVHVDSLDKLDKVSSELNFPFVLKPVKGHLSMFAYKISSKQQLQCVKSELAKKMGILHFSSAWILSEGFICESWIDGPIISVEIAANDEELFPIAVAVATYQNESPCIGYGSIIPINNGTDIAKQCIRYSLNICRLFGLSFGLFDLEMVWTKHGPILLEANARRMGGEMSLAFELSTSIPFNTYLFELVKGLKFTVPIIENSTLIRKVMPKTAGVISSGFDVSIFNSFRDGIYIRNYNLTPGKQVQPMEVLARILITTKDAKEAFAEANEILTILEAETMLELVYGFFPDIIEV